MAIEVFWGSGSPFAWRVLLALEVKRLPYESHLLEFSQRDHKTPAYIALNPRGQVPTLRDGGYVVYESIAILAYLDRKYPETPLFGTTAEETGTVWQVICESASYLEQAADDFILPIYRNQAAEKADQLRALLPTIHEELGRLETRLRERAWLATPALSAADIAVFPFIKSLQRAAGKPAAAAFEHHLSPLSAQYPAIDAWRARIEALPGYERTYPPHWR
jgi:glutathione S-transferase